MATRGSVRSPRGRGTSSRTSRGARRPGAPLRSGAPAKKKETASGPRITSRAVILLSVVVLLLGSYTASFRAWHSARQELRATQAEARALEQQIDELRNDKQRFDDPAYIRQQARERFGWVMPGEVGYRVIGSDGSVRGEVPELAAPPEVKTPQWYDRVWGTVETAGRGEKSSKPTEPSGKPLTDAD